MAKSELNRLADALDAFWNASIMSVHKSEAGTDFTVVSAMAEGFAAVAQALRDSEPVPEPKTWPTPELDKVTDMALALLDDVREDNRMGVATGIYFLMQAYGLTDAEITHHVEVHYQMVNST